MTKSTPQNQPEPQSDELDEILDEIAQYLPDEMSTLNHNDLPETKQRLEAWGRKQRVDELKHLLKDNRYRMLISGFTIEDIDNRAVKVRITELQGGKND